MAPSLHPRAQDDRLREKMPGGPPPWPPSHLDFDEEMQLFATQLGGLVPAGAVIAMDECGPTHYAGSRRSPFSSGAPKDAGRVISTAKASKTPDELSAMREGLRITELAVADVQAKIAPSACARPTSPAEPFPAHHLRGRCRRQHPRSDLAGDA